MFNTNSTVYKVLLVVSLLLVVFGMVCCVCSFFTVGVRALLIVESIAQIAALLFASIYMYKGAGKDNAKWMQSFLATYTLATLLSVISIATAGSGVPSSLLAISIICFLLILLVAFTKDSGKMRSYFAAGVILLLKVIDLVIYLGSDVPYPSHWLYIVPNLILAVLLFVLVYIKYLDKQKRGRDV